MIRSPPRSTRPYTLFPYTSLFLAGRRRAALLRGFRLRLLDRFLERRHQVDDVRGAAPRRLVLLLDDLAVALRFALARDQFVERVDIAVVEFLRVERRGLLLDQRLGEVGQFGVGPGVGDIAGRPEEHTSELQSRLRISSAVFSLQKK